MYIEGLDNDNQWLTTEHFRNEYLNIVTNKWHIKSIDI